MFKMFDENNFKVVLLSLFMTTNINNTNFFGSTVYTDKLFKLCLDYLLVILHVPQVI